MPRIKKETETLAVLESVRATPLEIHVGDELRRELHTLQPHEIAVVWRDPQGARWRISQLFNLSLHRIAFVEPGENLEGRKFKVVIFAFPPFAMPAEQTPWMVDLCTRTAGGKIIIVGIGQ